MSSVRKVVVDILEDMSKQNFDKFCHQLVDRREEPRVRRNRVEGKSFLEIADVLVSTFTEARAPEVAAEILRGIGCNEDAEKLVKVMSGQSSQPGPSGTKEMSGQSSQPGPSGTVKASAGAAGGATMAEGGGSEKHHSKWIQEKETRNQLQEKLLETLGSLSDVELERFKLFLRHIERKKGLPRIPRQVMMMADRDEIVLLLVMFYGQQSVEVTREAFLKINRRDLEQRLSEISSGSKAKETSGQSSQPGPSGKKHHSKWIQEKETRNQLQEKLLETLGSLSDMELERFKLFLRHIERKKGLPRIPRQVMMMADRDEIVLLLVMFYGQQSVEVTREAFLKINRRDLEQRLSEISSGSKAKETSGQSSQPGPSGKKHHSKWIQEKVTRNQLQEKLLETLGSLSDVELERFKLYLRYIEWEKDLPRIPMRVMMMADRDETAQLLVMFYGQQSVEVTREAFLKINRRDLEQRLSEISSGSKAKETSGQSSQPGPSGTKETSGQSSQPGPSGTKETSGQSSQPGPSGKKHQFKWIQEEVTRKQLREKLLETLEDLSDMELEHFKSCLCYIERKKRLPSIPMQVMMMADRDEAALLMVMFYSQQAVAVTREVLNLMNTRDPEQRLSEISSSSKEKHHSKWIQEEITRAQLQKKLLERLNNEDFLRFKQLLCSTETMKSFPRRKISKQRVMPADRDDLVKQMRMIFGQQSVEVTREVLKTMKISDLELSSSEIRSESNAAKASAGAAGGATMAEGGGSVKETSGQSSKPGPSGKKPSKQIQEQVSSDWTELDPEVNSTDAVEAPTYSLQSEAGNFECSVYALRWVCKEKISFRYQFCSLKNHMERIESMQYMPASPLMDITVIAGKFDEVYLPHWICVDDNPTILDKFAVLHIDDCGDVVEKVSEVTSSHVKLSEPAFSLKMILVKVGFSVEINSKVLIYGTRKQFSLTLHVYLIPPDVGLLQDLDKTESSYGYRRIRKPHPRNPLKMHDWFILTAELDGAEIATDEVQLRYESTEPNFSEVFARNPQTDLTLKLGKENESQPVWTCVIRQEEYQIVDGPTEGEHFVDKHRAELINRVSDTKSILDQLLEKKVIQQESYDEILAISTARDQMRKLYSGPLNAAGHDGKEIFYKILEEKQKFLISDLKKNLW